MIRQTTTYLAALLSVLLLASANSLAASDAVYPEGWEGWPITSKGVIPPNSEAIPAGIPAIVQETIKTYNWINEGKGSPYYLRFNPAQKTGSYSDQSTAVLELTDIGVILVTEHFLGEPVYGTFSSDGKDITSAHPSLAPKVCLNCHSGYGEACIAGVCSKK